MPVHPPARWVRRAAALLFVLTAATPAWSQEQQGFAREGGFIGVSYLPDFTLDGVTFDGETVYKEIGGEELIILPRLDVRNLARFILGYHGPQGSLELSYDRTRHDATFLGFGGEATFQAVNVDGRLFFARGSRVQPHVLLGGAFPWLSIKDGAFLDPDVEDAAFTGYGLNTEAGATVYLHPRLGVSVGYSYRMLWFRRATGVNDRRFELKPRFRETIGGLFVTGQFIF